VEQAYLAEIQGGCCRRRHPATAGVDEDRDDLAGPGEEGPVVHLTDRAEGAGGRAVQVDGPAVPQGRHGAVEDAAGHLRLPRVEVKTVEVQRASGRND